jgi:glycosyltransferase involved in cell wall biosynthesis
MKSVSITIPCRNEEQYIHRCLQSIVDCDFDKKLLSVFVCDGLSNDNTQEIIKEFSRKYSFIHLIENTKRTTPFALNLGLKANNAEIKIILGAHAEIYPDYINKCIEAFNFDEKIACVGGIIKNVYENDTAEVIGKAMSSGFGVGNAHFRTGQMDGYVDTVAFGAYKKEVFDKIGYFDEELIRNQDDEFNFRLLKYGFKIYLFRQIRSKYYVRASFKKLYKQYFQYGYWKVYVNKKHQTITTIRQIVPLLFVLYLFGGALLSIFHPIILRAYLIVFCLYFFAGIYSASRQSNKVSDILNIVKCFFILHFSYGFGYLLGIIDFFGLRKSIKTEERLSR